MTSYFVDVKELDNIIQKSDVYDNPNKLLLLFLFHEWDVIYISERGKLNSIVSIGDIYRYYESGHDEFIFNTQFSYILEIDNFEADKIFDKIKTIYEVPVIKQGEFIGVVRKDLEHTEKEWDRIHRKMNTINRSCFLINELQRWMEKTKGIELYIYGNVAELENYLTNEQCLEYRRKWEYICSAKYSKYTWAIEHGFSMEWTKLKCVQNKGRFFVEDYSSPILNVAKKHRVTPNAERRPHKIFFLGPCTSFGAYVKDTETIEYYIQENINKNNYPYEVVNCAILGGPYEEQGLFLEEMDTGDKVVLCLSTSINREVIKRNFPKEYKYEWSKVFSEIHDPIGCWVDIPAHCNEIVNKKIAESIWEDLCMEGEWIREDTILGKRKALQDYYIPYEIHKYVDEYIEKYSLFIDKSRVTGAIVMNCNPFTKGHRYLIEKASAIVDFLYIFVVEEDKSYYSFKDRFEMVKCGVSDLSNVIVLPSGKFILSKETFAQYFDKESIKDVEDMSWDIRIFGEVVAKKLGITYRFVGEEPKDIVTREYNETMKKILPEYSINVVEIPRICTKDSNEVISATKVRELCKKKEWEAVKKYCPYSTTEYLINKV